MPYYDYQCPICKHETEIVKKISEYDSPEQCPKCYNEMDRLISAGHFLYASVEEAEFNHGLGCVVKNRKHRTELAKRKGFTEVGNEKLRDEVKHNPYEI